MNRILRVLPIAFFLVAWSATSFAKAELPNLVVYISDDLGRLETSVYGNDQIKTPAMESLAASGMTFNNAYVASPSCCPNRFSLQTGLMPARHGAHPNHSQPKAGTKFLLPQLQSLGYTVLSFGKIAHGRDKMPGTDFQSLMPTNLFHNITQYFAKEKLTGPICLLVGDRRPHVSWTPEMQYDPNALTLPKHFIDTPETRQHWSRYFTDITGMDAEMGQVRDFVQEQLGPNTVFLFTSDHGGQWPLGKWNLYDYGTRVPLIVSWPGKIAAGVRTDAMVSWVDLIPTLMDIADDERFGDRVSIENAPSEIDGKSFAPVLLGTTETHREAIFTTHTGDGNMNVFPIRSIRRGKFKYIVNLRPDAYHTNHSDRDRKDGAGAYWDSWDEAAKTDTKAAAKLQAYYTRPAEELFDLMSDPHEYHNLASDPAYATILEELKRELTQWTTSQGDTLQPHREPYPKSEPLPIVK